LTTWPSLEAQVAAISDDIAYDNHDIDDGLHAGFLALDELLAQPFVADLWRTVEKRYPHAPRDRQLRELIRGQIGLMVNDVIAETQRRTQGMTGPADVRGAQCATAAFSSQIADGERAFKRYMYDKLYYHPDQLATAERARAVIAELFAAYSQEPMYMDEDWYARLPELEPDRSRHIADYVAGMTDRFAISRHAQIYGRTPEGLRNV
jgi:dGTPase